MGEFLFRSLVSCGVGVAFAQQPLGIIVGTVTDPTGATLSAATVTVTNTETQVGQTVVTNATGDYSLPYLLNETSTIKAEHAGFRTALISHAWRLQHSANRTEPTFVWRWARSNKLTRFSRLSQQVSSPATGG